MRVCRVVDNALDDVVQVRFGIHSVQTCRADEAVHRGSALATRVRTDEQEVASSNSHTEQRARRPGCLFPSSRQSSIR